MLKLKKYELLYNSKKYINFHTKIIVRIKDNDKDLFFKKMNIKNIIPGKKDAINNNDKAFSNNVLEFENDDKQINMSVYYVIIQSEADFNKFVKDFNIKNIIKRGKSYTCYWNCEKIKYYSKDATFYCSKNKYTKPKYPIYVISKGRYKKHYFTTKHLILMKLSFNLIIEKDEENDYKNLIKKLKGDEYVKILILPKKLKTIESSTPARNFAWNNSIKAGHKKHWILDDNINGFYRYNKNCKRLMKDGSFFTIIENISDNYKNVMLSSPQYSSFVPEISLNRKKYIINSRCYSCILINNKIDKKVDDMKWRLKYNEDTDLTLRVLKTKKYTTLLFNCLLIGKMATGTCKGGNQKIYKNHTQEGYKLKLQTLQKYHPEVKTSFKNKKIHHHIDYSIYKQKLVKSKNKKIKNWNKYIKINKNSSM